jgi:predicted ribosome quality control (RQC) complex YloA/Tae2 family protein
VVYSFPGTMELDYITIKLVCGEILPLVKSSQIREVVATGPRSISFILWNEHEIALLISAEPSHSRIHILDSIPSRTGTSDEHFHRVIRHHISGAIIDDLNLVDGERIIEISAERKDFSGETKRYVFIAELMGRHSNLILTDESGTILTSDHAQRIKGERSRDIRPGKTYSRPPIIGRIPLKTYSYDDFIKFLSSADEGVTWGRLLLDSFAGITPGFVRYIGEKSQTSDTLTARDLSPELVGKLHDSYIKAVQRLRDGLLFPPFDNLLEFKLTDDYPINRALARYFGSVLNRESDEKRETAWKKTAEAKIKQLEKLVSNLKKDKSKADESNKFRKLGDLIYAFPSAFEIGTREVEVDDIFNPDCEEKIKIRLLPGKNAIETAQEYHKRASRMTRGEKEIESRLKLSIKQLEDFTNLIEPPEEVLKASDERFEKALDNLKTGQISKILKNVDASKRDKSGGHSKTKSAAKPEPVLLPRNLRGENIHHYKSPEGHDVFVGGNDRANEALYKWGQPDDYWLHVKNMPGSHVLIPHRGEAIDFDTILFAAQIAVHHSSAKGSTKVTVDYTMLKYVTKPSGAAAGFVTYKKEKSVRVDSPDEKKLEKSEVK